MSGINREIDRLATQVGALHVFTGELQTLEQWNMPSEWRERALRIRNGSAPMFFSLVAALLQDALVQGLANILDRPETLGKPNLTLEAVIQHHADPIVQARCMKRLSDIRSSQTYADIKRARNQNSVHSDYATMITYDTLTPRDFPGLRPTELEATVRSIMETVAELAGKFALDFVWQDWKGVDMLFGILEAQYAPEAEE